MNFKTEPFSHQLQALDISKDMKAFALLMDMGTGKSKVAIDNIAYLATQGKITGALIVVQKGLPENWVNQEFVKHFPDAIEAVYHIWSNKKSKKEEAKIKSFLNASCFKVLAVNIEAFRFKANAIRRKAVYGLCKRFLTLNDVFMVVDESTDIKSSSALQTRRLITLGKLAAYKRILTGSPVDNHLNDLYSQFNFLDPDIFGMNNFANFKARYCQYKMATTWVAREINGIKRQVEVEYPVFVKYHNLAELKAKMKPYCYRVELEQCIDLPKCQRKTVYIKMSKEQESVHKMLLKEVLLELPEGELFAIHHLTKLLRLQEVTSGFVGLDTGKFPIAGVNPKLKAMLKICRETSSKVAIWARFQFEHSMIIDLLKKEFGEKSVVAKVGIINSKLSDEAPFEFQNNPDVRFFVGNPQIGKGYDLFAGHVNIYVSNTWRNDDRMQTEKRMFRHGQKKSVLYVDLIVPGTIDEKILEALKNKKDLADTITGSIRSFVKEI